MVSIFMAVNQNGKLTHTIGKKLLTGYELKQMKIRRSFNDVAPCADQIQKFFVKQNLICEIGGSFRRRSPTVGDLDFVVQTSSLDKIQLPDWVSFERLGDLQAHGIIDLDGQPLGIDIWCATPEQWGAFMWFITGSKELNIKMRGMAKRKGFKLSQFGLFCDDAQIDDGTERGVASALGFDWIDPIDRDKFARRTSAPDFVVKIASSLGDKTYDVSCVGLQWFCSCPHNTYRRTDCKHIWQAQRVFVAVA